MEKTQVSRCFVLLILRNGLDAALEVILRHGGKTSICTKLVWKGWFLEIELLIRADCLQRRLLAILRSFSSIGYCKLVGHHENTAPPEWLGTDFVGRTEVRLNVSGRLNAADQSTQPRRRTARDTVAYTRINWPPE